mmetsp:Transcript_80177/g.259123  ORF Transcript_80177/g.259123 Transcript_80177/m.259123 type:complete len:229 (+) Transcript_80177:601-1287(+)
MAFHESSCVARLLLWWADQRYTNNPHVCIGLQKPNVHRARLQRRLRDRHFDHQSGADFGRDQSRLSRHILAEVPIFAEVSLKNPRLRESAIAKINACDMGQSKGIRDILREDQWKRQRLLCGRTGCTALLCIMLRPKLLLFQPKSDHLRSHHVAELCRVMCIGEVCGFQPLSLLEGSQGLQCVQHTELRYVVVLQNCQMREHRIVMVRWSCCLLPVFERHLQPKQSGL